MLREDLRAYASFRDQQPLIGDYRRHGAPAPVKTTDVIAMRDFLKLDLYQNFYRPLGIRYQLAIGVPENREWTVGYTLSRGGRFRRQEHRADDAAAGVPGRRASQRGDGVAAPSVRGPDGNAASRPG